MTAELIENLKTLAGDSLDYVDLRIFGDGYGSVKVGEITLFNFYTAEQLTAGLKKLILKEKANDAETV